MGKRPAAAPKIGMQESSFWISFMAVIFYVEFYVGSTTSPDRNEESIVLKFLLLWLPYVLC